MAKNLYSGDYTFDASERTVSIDGNYTQNKLLLITNVTDGIIIYNFAEDTLGASAISYDNDKELTTITLLYDTTSMDDSDALQIFTEGYYQHIHMADDLIDGVGKIRVSNPENLIDTDFEYGLQPTKWETLETSNWVPSFYVGEGDLALTIVSSINAVANSSLITVQCSEAHGLAVGTPIDVQGLSSRTAEGKYLIKATTTNSFTYTANAAQTTTGSIGSIYSTVTPGSFYTGSEIAFDPASGISSDNATQSSITVTTNDPHGFKANSNFYLVNTVGAKTFNLTDTTSSNAPDGRPYIDPANTITKTFNPDQTLTETKQMRTKHHVKFSSSAVSTVSNTITWNSHGLQTDDCVMYLKPAGDTAVGGLTSFTEYWIIVIDDNTVSLSATPGGNAINLSSAGTSALGRHSLNLMYEIYYYNFPRRNYNAYWYTRHHFTNQGSGHDLTTINDGSYGLGAGTIVKHLLVSRYTGNRFYYGTNRNSYWYYSPYRNSNMTLGDTGTNPKNFNFMEDYNRFDFTHNGYWDGTQAHQGGNRYFRTYKYYWDGTYNGYLTSSSSRTFIMPLVRDDEADSFYYENHGLSSGNTIDVTTNSGTNFFVSNSTLASPTNNNNPIQLADGEYSIEKVSDNRFKLSNYRLQHASGNYTFDAELSNTTKNSIYLPQHGLTNTDSVAYNVESGGVNPTSNTGQILPNYTLPTTTSTLPQVHSTIDSIVDSYFTSQSITTQDFVTASTANSSRIANTGVSSGTSSLVYYDLHYTTHVFGGTMGQVNIPSSNFYLSNLSSTQPYNLLSNTTLNVNGRTFAICASDWSANTTMDKYLWVAGSNRTSSSENWYAYFRDGGQFTGGSMRGNNNLTNQQRTVVASGNDYRFAWYGFCYTRTSSPSTVYLRIVLKNYSDWATATTNSYVARTTNNSSYWYGQDTNSNSYRQKDDLELGLFFMLDSAETWGNNTDLQNMVHHIIDEFDANFVYPALTGATTYKVNVINNDRISLKSTANDIEVDITNNGTQPLSFKTQGVLGVIDGSYTAASATDDTFSFTSNTQVEGQTVLVDAANGIVGTDTLKVESSGTHSFLNGTQVTYSNNGGTDISGLTDASVYYVNVVDDEHFRLAATEDDAVNGTNIISLTAGVGTSHSFITQSLAGIVEAEGTVDVTSGSTKIEGNTSLFKRYFKAGDTIFLKDDNATPGSLETFKVTAVADDTTLTVDTAPTFSTTASKYFVGSKVYARPDGYSVHRPFDGGVEIAAGTAPYSHICRQTRKYFRYQSGKGIQTSLAINFNPPVTLESLSAVSGLSPTNETYTVTNNGNVGWNIAETALGDNPALTLYRGATYTFNINATGHPFYFTTDDGTNYVSGSYVDEYTSGVTGSRTEVGTVTFVVPSNAPDNLYYACGNHAVMIGMIQILDYPSNQGLAKTKYPHRLNVGQDIEVRNASDPVYNGTREVVSIIDDFQFRYSLSGTPVSSAPGGIIKYNLDGYSGAFTRAGMFDFQNGFFFEYDGSTLNCVRRSSTTQLSGTVQVVNNSGLVTGNGTSFLGQLTAGDRIVLRGQSYKVVRIDSNTQLYVQPGFRGISTEGVIVTKTEDVKVPQENWNIDRCDGTGPTGFVLNLNKIQMAYMDYSWYGAGKIRFGFKERTGQIRYCHQFIHNNRLDEAYMRSGNIPAKYEIENDDNPTYAPTLFHWGTSVIMDGTFDDDKAYLFTAPSKSLSFTNGETSAVTTTGASSLQGFYNWSRRQYDWYVRIPFNSNDASKFYSGLKLYTADGSLNGEEVSYTSYSGSTFYVYIYVQTSRNQPAVYPSASNAEAVNLGVPAGGGGSDDSVNLGTDTIPLVSLRLAPSVDGSLTGNLGERDIINRMQLKLNEVGLILTHDCEVKLILNGDLSNVSWENVATPSLSQLIKHDGGDIVTGGTEIFSFRASGGATDNTGARLSATSDFKLDDIIDLGNAILGGNEVYPNGPDILTVAVQVVDTGGIGADNPFKSSARITWSESQA